MERVLIWLVVTAAFAALCMTRPQAGRIAVGLFFLAMALGVNGAILLVDPQVFVTFAGQAYLPLYREVALRVATPNPALFGLAVMAFELAVATCALQKGRAVTVGVEEAPCLILAAALV